jgi:hypothetical protein
MLIEGSSLPCVLQATDPLSEAKPYSMAIGVTTTATANITPMTEMVTARVLGNEPSFFAIAFDGSTAVQTLTTAALQAEKLMARLF